MIPNLFPFPGRWPSGAGGGGFARPALSRGRKLADGTPGALGAAALAALLAACGSGQAAPHPSASPGGQSAASPAATSPAPSGPPTRLVSYPVRVGPYHLVNKKDHPVATTTRDRKFSQKFSFAATARDGLYRPGHQAHQNVFLIAGRLAQGVSPSTAIQDYLSGFQGQEVHLTTEPAGPLGGQVRCWEAGGFTFCMWADNGTYGIFDYQPPFGLDTALIRHLAGVVPRFRRVMERAGP